MLGAGCIDTDVNIANDTMNTLEQDDLNKSSEKESNVINTVNASNFTETEVSDIVSEYNQTSDTPSEIVYESQYIEVGNIETLGGGRTYIASTWVITDSKDNPVNYQNNLSAVDPTYAQVVKFIKNDKTDEIRLNELPSLSDVIIPIHDNAERQGIRTGIVVTQSYYDTTDMCVAFNTTDKGVVYFSCVYEDQDFGPQPHDAIVKIKIGDFVRYTDLTTRSHIPTMDDDGFEVIGFDTFW